MINIESLVFDTVYNQLHNLFPAVNITAGYDLKDATFPTVVISEVESIPYQDGNTDECAENFTRVTYEVEVYSDKVDTGRSECKTILAAADSIMQSMKFRRTHTNRPININRTTWKQYARYEAIVGKPIEVGNNTVYQMYRR